METKTEQGYLILADISGYTSYLAGVELTHARDVLTELLELIVEHFKPTLTIAKLEGDAVFGYTSKANVERDETLLEILDSTYLAFRDRIESILRRTTCECNACRSIPNLDLKFVLHYGEYLLQNVSGIPELVGSDINLVHRLLKNTVSAETGWHAYVLMTEAGCAQLNVHLDNLHEQVEGYEHLGDVRTFSYNLHARHKELVEGRRQSVSPEDADMTMAINVPLPPVAIWDWMNDIQKRLQWEAFDDIRPQIRIGGRTGPGSLNHCAHGKNVTPETVVDWRPFETYTLEYPMGFQTRTLVPQAEGTEVIVCFKLKSSLPAWLNRLISRIMFTLTKAPEQFRTLVKLASKEGANEIDRDPPKPV